MDEIISFIKDNNPDLYTKHEKDFNSLRESATQKKFNQWVLKDFENNPKEFFKK
jgi:hypothetical protein